MVRRDLAEPEGSSNAVNTAYRLPMVREGCLDKQNPFSSVYLDVSSNSELKATLGVGMLVY